MGQQRAPHVDAKAIDHIELRVNSVYPLAKLLCETFGFEEIAYADRSTGRKFTESSVLRQGESTFILSAPLVPNCFLANTIKAHGEGVHDVAFLVDDVVEAHESALRRGAIQAANVQGFDGTIAHSAIEACRPVVHTLIERKDYQGVFAPGFVAVDHPRFKTQSTGLKKIDHVVLNVAPGHMLRQASFYERIFGFREIARFSPEQISTPKAALESIVVRSPNGAITMPINEPVEGKPGHIGEFLRDRHGPGVQHIAFETDDIVQTVSMLRSRGVAFIDTPPDTYYADHVPQCLGAVGKKWGRAELDALIAKIKPLGILIDQDKDGYLLQVFTKVLVGRGEGLFFEFIERRGSDGFGVNNFKALFESIERAAGRL